MKGQNKTNPSAEPIAVPADGSAPFKWETVGLEVSEYMPVEFEGKTYNLAALTEWEAKFLIGHGTEMMPFLRQK